MILFPNSTGFKKLFWHMHMLGTVQEIII